MNVALWFEGSHHDFDATARWFCDALSDEGLRPARRTLEQALTVPADLVVFGGLVYSGTEGYTTPQDIASRLRAVRSPILALHSVLGSWDDVAELDEFWDGRWVWGTSDHSPVESFPVRVLEGHPLMLGLSDFTTTDELYYKLRTPHRSEVLLEAEYAGERWPLAWTRPGYVYCGLGHDVAALENPPTREFVIRMVRGLLDPSPGGSFLGRR